MTTFIIRLFSASISCLLLFTCTVIGQQLLPADQQKLLQFEQDASTYKEQGNQPMYADCLNKIGMIYWHNEIYDKALEHFFNSIEINRAIGNRHAMMQISSYVATIYFDIEQYSNALKYYNESLSYCKKAGSRQETANLLLNIASVRSELNQPAEVIKTVNEALSIALELKDKRGVRRSYGLLAESYNALGDAQNYVKYFEMYTTLEKDLKNDEVNEKLDESKKAINVIRSEVKDKELLLDSAATALRYTQDSLKEYEELSQFQKTRIDLLEKERELREAKLENIRLTNWFFAAVIVFILILGFVLLYNFLQNRDKNNRLAQQNKEIEKRNLEIGEQHNILNIKQKELETAFNCINEQNFQITSSLYYAQSIQQAMLPKPENIQTYLPESFIYLRPRDIVSGDFFWFTEIKQENTQTGSIDPPLSDFIIAAVDCTGHGVPGAFMSLVGMRLLDEIVNRGITSPNEILNKLNQGIRIALKQDTTDNRDGMDIAICVIKQKERVIEFAGAKNPLVYIQDGKLNRIRGNIMLIGGGEKESNETFTKHTIPIDKPTTCYIFSDGFADQFGGGEKKKFMTKNFYQLLTHIHLLPMSEQPPLLNKALDDWREKAEQIDDVLVIGFRLS